MINNVIKRDNKTKVVFDRNKIKIAITKANNEVPKENRISENVIDKIIDSLECLNKEEMHVEEIQDYIESALMTLTKYKLAKAYITYRYKRDLVRKSNTTDESILSLIRNTNEEVARENSNKKAAINSTKRDLIAGEVSKDITNRILLPKRIVEAHDKGTIHFHDKDYFMMQEFNCCLPNFRDMLENGTAINGVAVETPKSFWVACNQITQIMASVSSNQYGGQTFYSDILGKYYAYTKKKFTKRITENIEKTLPNLSAEDKDAIVKSLVDEEMEIELRSGIQTIQYQINTLCTCNGQSPFVTIFMYLRDDDPYKEEHALIIEEILKQRLAGIKNKNGVPVTPTFPKLIYVLTEENNLTGGKYDYLTHLAASCTAKRLYPDYISEKVMKENYDGEVFGCMGCRSFLSAWKDPNTGKMKWEGRFNQGVVTLNLPQIALESGKDMEKFWELFEDRLSLCYEALMCRHKALEGTISDVSPIHWQDGAIARLKPGETIDKLLHDGYSTLSLGYIGVYECTKHMTGYSHTEEVGREFSLKVMNRMKNATESWKAATGIGFGLYGTPAESTCYTLCKKDKETYGEVENVTDKDWYTNSYHCDVREPINAFDKLKFESIYQKISSGGAISYVEIPNMTKNIEAIEEVIKFIYDTIQYAEFNTKSDYCNECGFDGEIVLNKENKWECPNCGNTNLSTMYILRRTCGYCGTAEGGWNEGKTKEIGQRVIHLY